MRFLIRLLGALWLATLLVSAGFAWSEVRAERQRLADDLQRRAALAADAVREASRARWWPGARGPATSASSTASAAQDRSHRHLRRVRLA